MLGQLNDLLQSSYLRVVLPSLSLLLASGCASDNGASEFSTFAVTRTEGFVDVIAQLRSQSQESTTGSIQTITDELVLEERLGFTVKGFSYHPNLIDFTAAAVIGSMQHSFQEQGTATPFEGNDIGIIAEFDITADILKNKPYPGRIHLKTDQTTQHRPFRSSLSTSRSVQGLSWRYEDETYPMHVNIEHRKTEYEPLDESDVGGLSDTTRIGVGGVYRINSKHQIKLEYEHLALLEEPSGLDYSSDEITLIHSLRWGDDNRTETRIEYFDQYGNVAISRLRGRSDLRMNLWGDLTGRASLEYRDQARGSLLGMTSVEDQTVDFNVGLGYKLYDSLIANLDAHYRTQSLNAGAESTDWGSRLDLNYRKKNAIGVLGLDYSFDQNRDTRQASTSLPVSVFDEGHTFDVTDRFRLDNRRAIAASIVVTDSTNVTTYQEGLDYIIQLLGDEIEVERLLGGTILAGQSVLVDYQFDVGGNFTLSSVGHSISISQDFSFGLSLGYLYRTQGQTLIEGSILDAAFESFTAHSMRAAFRWEALEARSRYEIFDSNISETSSIRAGVRYNHAFDFGARVSASVDWNGRSETRPTPRSTTYMSFGTQYRQRFFGSLDVDIGARWRLGMDDLSGDTQGVNIDTNVVWRHGKTEVRGSFIYNDLSGDFSSNSSTAILFQLRRTF